MAQSRLLAARTPFPLKRFHFDAVVFDLDGTLVATERTWPDAGRAAALRFLSEPDAPPVDIPNVDGWMEMIGLPLDQAVATAFPQIDDGQRARFIELCEEEQGRLLDRGRAQLLPGTKEAMEALRADGVRIGVASNCRQDYLDAMMKGLGLEQWVEEPRCLASPGVRDKAGMIQDLARTFDTRSVVMVGDRRGDRDAAWANGFPFVHVPRGYGTDARVAVEATLDGLDQLPGLLEQRTTALDAILDAAAGRSIDVTGRPMSGVTMLERDLERRAAETDVHPSSASALAVHCVADQEVLLRRAKGLRIGPGPIEDLARRLRSAGRSRSGDLVVDLSNPIAPTLGGVRAGA